VVCTYQDMDELLLDVVKVEKLLGEIGENHMNVHMKRGRRN